MFLYTKKEEQRFLEKRENQLLTILNSCLMKKELLMLAVITATMAISQSCNVTRKITTESSYFQKGDTTTTIVTRTTESYDARKNTFNN